MASIPGMDPFFIPGASPPFEAKKCYFCDRPATTKTTSGHRCCFDCLPPTTVAAEELSKEAAKIDRQFIYTIPT